MLYVLSKRQKKKCEGGSLCAPHATAHTFVVTIAVQTRCLHVSVEEMVALSHTNYNRLFAVSTEVGTVNIKLILFGIYLYPNGWIYLFYLLIYLMFLFFYF